MSINWDRPPDAIDDYDAEVAAHRATKAKLRELRAAVRWAFECDAEHGVNVANQLEDGNGTPTAWGIVAKLANYKGR